MCKSWAQQATHEESTTVEDLVRSTCLSHNRAGRLSSTYRVCGWPTYDFFGRILLVPSFTRWTLYLLHFSAVSTHRDFGTKKNVACKKASATRRISGTGCAYEWCELRRYDFENRERCVCAKLLRSLCTSSIRCIVRWLISRTPTH
jgi:hypothetical protein